MNHLEIKNLTKTFSLGAGLFNKEKKVVYALNDVSLKIKKGEIFGIVGESGSGKTTLARTIVGAYKADSGEVIYKEKTKLNKRSMKNHRSEIKYVFQDPASSMDPRLTVLEILTAGLKYSNKFISKLESLEKAIYIMEKIGMSESDLYRRPMDFSGGQRQRISLARALMYDPEILVCDEVVSALDVSIQSQIINMLIDLKNEFDLTIIFIAHDLSVVSYLCDSIAVMYGGRVVEYLHNGNIFKDASHPYTQMLASSIPTMETDFSKFKIDDKVFDALDDSKLCPYCSRCEEKVAKCKKEFPEFEKTRSGYAACFKIKKRG